MSEGYLLCHFEMYAENKMQHKQFSYLCLFSSYSIKDIKVN